MQFPGKPVKEKTSYPFTESKKSDGEWSSPTKKKAELIFYKGKSGADSRLYYGEGAQKKAAQASKQGFNGFYLKARSGEKAASEDLKRAEAFINDNTEYLDVGKVVQ